MGQITHTFYWGHLLRNVWSHRYLEMKIMCRVFRYIKPFSKMCPAEVTNQHIKSSMKIYSRITAVCVLYVYCSMCLLDILDSNFYFNSKNDSEAWQDNIINLYFKYSTFRVKGKMYSRMQIKNKCGAYTP